VTYPPHLSDASALLDRLWGSADLARVFPNAIAKATLPWPRGRRLPGGRLFDRASLDAELAEPLPAIALLDPRTLWASQPYVTRAGVEYYLGSRWFRTGDTYADQHVMFNRLPVVERRADGTDVLLGGHHRSCAALLAGEPVLARCIVHVRREVDVERVALELPSLAIGRWSAAHAAGTVGEAVACIHTGARVRLPTPELAHATRLALRGT
jgi:hypothetical protein